jgi:acetylornithine deacetylase/succinyl-diaminopimelate desuccinylase-like protein
VTEQRIDAHLQEHFDQYIAETVRLCAQPSISARGEGIQECADLVAQILREHGLQVRKFTTPGNPVVVGHADGASPRTLLFYNHYDVQPPEPLELWTSPPFQPTIRDGALYARGVADDKGELVARLAAVDAVRAAHDGALPCGVTFVVEGEEEVGSPYIAQFVREHLDLLKAHGAIWEVGGVDAEGRPAMSLGVRGVLSVELSVQAMRVDAHSGDAHILPNAAWRLLWALAALKGPDERIRIPGFYDQAGPPTARDEQLLDALPDYEQQARQLYGVQEFIGGMTGKDLNRAVFNPTCNIGGLTAGYQGPGTKTVIPSQASAKLDFRLVPGQDPEDILDRLRTYLSAAGFADVQVTRLGAMGPAKTPPDDPFVVLTTRTGEEVYGQPAVLDPLAGGSSPIYAFAGPLGDIPVVFAGVGYFGCLGHAPNEHIRLDDFLQGTRHVARILDRFAGL